MLIFFLHGVATRDVKYADDLRKFIRDEFTRRGMLLPYFYASFWGNVLSDVGKMWNWIHQDLQYWKQRNSQTTSENCFRYQKFREGFLSEFMGDFLTYLNPERGTAVRRAIAQQLEDFLDDYPNEREIHFIAHSLGSVILWDTLFSDRFSENDPAFRIRRRIAGFPEAEAEKAVTITSITTVGSPILFVNTTLNVRSQAIREFVKIYQEKPLRWLNLIHASDVVAYPLAASLDMAEEKHLFFRDEYLEEDANLAEKTARSLGQAEIAMGLAAMDAHISYLNSQNLVFPKAAYATVQNILGIALLEEVIARLSKVKGFTVVNDCDRSQLSEPFLFLKNGNGAVYLFVNNLNIHHVYVFDGDRNFQFGGYVGWLHTDGLLQALKLIEAELGMPVGDR